MQVSTCPGRLAVVKAHNGLRVTLVVGISEPRHPLSPRELQIARLVANGATNHAIAGRRLSRPDVRNGASRVKMAA